MSTNAKIVVGVVVVAVVALLVWNAGKAPSTSGQTIKIGVVVPLSGDAAAIGQEAQKVLDYRLRDVNGKPGAKIELVYEDGKCAGSEAVNAFQKLTNVDGIKVIIGGLCSSETLGMAPLTKNGEAVVVSPWSSNPSIEGASPYVFSTSYSDQVIGDTLAEQMKGYSRVAIITEQNDYNIGIKKVWEAKMASYPSVKIVANETFPKGSTSFRNLLAKVRQANPEAILLNPNAGVTADNLLKQLAEMKDWKGYKMYSQIAYLGDDSRKNYGSFADGMYIVDAPNMTDPNFLAYKDKIVKAKGTLDNLGSYYTATGIDTLDMVSSLVREFGNDPKAVRNALAQRTFNGYLGTTVFNGHSFREGSKGAVYAVVNGKATAQ